MNSFNSYIILKGAIKHNIMQCKKILDTKKICAVLKANAYGLGVNNVVKHIDDDVDFYAVACFIEAKKLRKLTNKPILVLNYVPINNINFCIKNNISITIFSLKQLKHIKKFLFSHKNFIYKNNDNNSLQSLNLQKIKIHFAINTGMNRIGFNDKNEFYKSSVFAKDNASYFNVEGIFTHFYNAENTKDTILQNSIFMQYINMLSLNYNLKDIIVHSSNSFATMKYSNLNCDMSRIGIALYGGLDYRNNVYSFKQVINVKSKLINIIKIKKGESVGYGKNYIAKSNMTIGVIPIGYADGILRSFSTNGKVLINGKFCKVTGSICMDMFMVDITNVKAKIFDEVVLIGKDKFGNEITINDFASFCGTIGYEVLTNIKQNRFTVNIV